MNGPNGAGGRAAAAGRANTLYDTVDQAALRRVDIRERDADSTVYRKVSPDGGSGDPA